MNITKIKEVMESYSKVAKNTIICIDTHNLSIPLFTIGLDILLFTKYSDFEEIISFLKDKLKQAAGGSVNSNVFHTLFTKKLFAYNIVFLNDRSEVSIALIAGPLLSYMPNNEFLKRIMFSNDIPYYKKHEFTEFLNNLPLASSERIYQLGKLLLTLSKTDLDSWNTSRQVLHGRENVNEELRQIYGNNPIYQEQVENELHAMYKFCAIIMDRIVHGNASGIRDVIGEYSSLFLSLETIVDNNRFLKNRCIIICSIACHFAIQANVSYERMIGTLWKYVAELEKLKATNDILALMSATLEEFAHAVLELSDRGYSLHINRVLSYIKSHLSEKITLNVLAEYVQISPVYLSSLLKKETKQSLSHHINLLRIEESKRLLAYTNKSIQEIAYDVGFSYQNHFNFVFKKYEGQTPLEYRKNMGTNNYVDFTK